MGKNQKVYTKEFKQEAVRLVQTSGKPITQIARELGVSDSAILILPRICGGGKS